MSILLLETVVNDGARGCEESCLQRKDLATPRPVSESSEKPLPNLIAYRGDHSLSLTSWVRFAAYSMRVRRKNYARLTLVTLSPQRANWCLEEVSEGWPSFSTPLAMKVNRHQGDGTSTVCHFTVQAATIA
jgi:hypothetical protein